MKKKSFFQILTILMLTFAISISASAGTNWDIDSGKGLQDGTNTDIWEVNEYQRPEGLRITVYDAQTDVKVFNTIDVSGYSLTNASDYFYLSDNYGELVPKTTWLANYNDGTLLSRQRSSGYQNQYIEELKSYNIISTNRADTEKVRSAVGAENFLRNICNLIGGLKYEEFAAGKYKIAFEPVMYFKFRGYNWALTATEVGILDAYLKRTTTMYVPGHDYIYTMRNSLGPLTHSTFPRTAFLAYKDLGVGVYKSTGADYDSNETIRDYMGVGIVSTVMTDAAENIASQNVAEYHTDTNVYTSFTYENTSTDDYIGSTTFSIYDSNGELPKIREDLAGDEYLLGVNVTPTYDENGNQNGVSTSNIYGYLTDELGITYAENTDKIKVFVDNPKYETEAYGQTPYKQIGTCKDGQYISTDVGTSFTYTIQNSSGRKIANGTVAACCPAGEEGMGWFEWKTPSTAQGVTITITVPDGSGVYILDSDGNRCTTLNINAEISKVEEITPPDPKVTDTRPSWQKIFTASSVQANIAQYASKDDVTELEWYVWSYDWSQEELERKMMSFNLITGNANSSDDNNPYRGASYEKTSLGYDRWGIDNRYYASEKAEQMVGRVYEGAVLLSGTPHKTYYSVSIDGEMTITPADECKTATVSGGVYTMKSGYGVQIDVTSHLSGDTQYCTGTQSANVLFPEFNYNRQNGAKYNRLLEKVGNSYVFKQNEFSTYNSRVHFTPIWFPDNKKYVVFAEVFDIWCPAGQLSAHLTDYVVIKGNVYDDWHIAPVKP